MSVFSIRSFLILFLCASLSACSSEPAPQESTTEPPEETIPFRKDGTLDFLREGEVLLTIDLEIAESDSARERGMMQRHALPGGMLFTFQQEQPQSFWMANTPLGLDLLFVSADSEIVDIAKYARPFSNDNITSAAPAQYVLEVEAGFTDSYGIIESDRIRWQRE